MKVYFTESKDNLIVPFTEYSLNESVKKTDLLEKKTRENKQEFSSEFFILDDDRKPIYRGVFEFGSYNHKNLYHQLKSNLPNLKSSKQNQAIKDYLLEKLEEVETEYKIEENINKALINVKEGQISKLVSWQRRLIYGATVFLVFLLIINLISFSNQKTAYEDALNDGREQLADATELNEAYEKGLTGKTEELITFLENENDLNDNQSAILMDHYVNKDEFEKAVTLTSDNYKKVETHIMLSNKFNDEKRKEKLNVFNEKYPTNEGKFDIAYLNKDYERVANSEDIEMILERSEMLTYSLLKLDKVDDAKAELKNNNNKELKDKITEYENIKTDIKTLEDKISKTKKKKEKNKLNKELKKKRDELQEI